MIVDLGFEVLETDTSIYVRGEVIIAVYVDDMLIIDPNEEECNKIYQALGQHFQIENKGEVKSFLDLNITRNWEQHTISINQPDYIDKLLARFKMTNAKTASTPFEPECELFNITVDDKLCDPTVYQEFTGSLNHLAVFSRPDIAFAVSKLSRFNNNPIITHYKAAQHVLRYLKGTRNYCITYRKSSIPTIALGYSDADHGSDKIDRISYTEYLFTVNGGLVS